MSRQTFSEAKEQQSSDEDEYLFQLYVEKNCRWTELTPQKTKNIGTELFTPHMYIQQIKSIINTSIRAFFTHTKSKMRYDIKCERDAKGFTMTLLVKKKKFFSNKSGPNF